MDSQQQCDSVSVRSILSGSVALRLLIGWGSVVIAAVAAPEGAQLPHLLLGAVLAALVVIIAYCAFGVVQQAEHLARRLGDPYGSLVLTLSIVVIEVILIMAVMLGPGESATIARDSVMAVSMVILNLVVGLALLVGALRHGSLRLNSAGSSTYLAMLIVLVTFGLIMPGVTGKGGAYTAWQQVVVVVITLAVYGFFLLRQTTAEASDYREPASLAVAGDHHDSATSGGIGQLLRDHRREVLTRAAVLVGTVLPIVLLSHDMAALLDDGLARMNAPIALAGLLIAMIVFLPEGITAVRAGLSGEAQRVINLCHGALVSTVGLTIPAVLLIGAATGQTVILAESLPHVVLLAVSLLLGMNTVLAKRVSAAHGAVHLAVFVAYAMTLFS
ncbi:MAG: calcium:proton antiporter [Nesterenkonia sp.]